ncbi:MAG TPA: alkaline phosphatase family protein, partial [Rhodocyclaceae bacterium]|nr:alkaline phosphatase family protein [Rhodocyclaceae bacterium]
MLPDYDGGSILNLIASIGRTCGGRFPDYAPLSLVPEHSFARARRLLLIVIDGLGDALLREAGQGTRLAAHRVGGLTSVFPSTTAAAVTTLMSGLAPAAHGLTGWHMLFEEAGGVLAVL